MNDTAVSHNLEPNHSSTASAFILFNIQPSIGGHSLLMGVASLYCNSELVAHAFFQCSGSTKNLTRMHGMLQQHVFLVYIAMQASFDG